MDEVLNVLQATDRLLIEDCAKKNGEEVAKKQEQPTEPPKEP